MRTIKFRAWDRLHHILLPVMRLTWGVGGVSLSKVGVYDKEGIVSPLHYYSDFDVDRFILMQFTGLHDKNGEEVYEGDLFGKMGGDVERPNEYEIHALVYFDNDIGAFCVDDQRGGWQLLSNYLETARNEREVIGNQYENSDLIKNSDNK